MPDSFVRATNSGGYSGFSNIATISTPAGTPLAPSGLAVTVISSSELRLNWTDGSSYETGFKIDRKIGGGSFAEVGQASANAVTYSDTVLSRASTYT